MLRTYKRDKHTHEWTKSIPKIDIMLTVPRQTVKSVFYLTFGVAITSNITFKVILHVLSTSLFCFIFFKHRFFENMPSETIDFSFVLNMKSFLRP